MTPLAVNLQTRTKQLLNSMPIRVLLFTFLMVFSYALQAQSVTWSDETEIKRDTYIDAILGEDKSGKTYDVDNWITWRKGK